MTDINTPNTPKKDSNEDTIKIEWFPAKVDADNNESTRRKESNIYIEFIAKHPKNQQVLLIREMSLHARFSSVYDIQNSDQIVSLLGYIETAIFFGHIFEINIVTDEPSPLKDELRRYLENHIDLTMKRMDVADAPF